MAISRHAWAADYRSQAVRAGAGKGTRLARDCALQRPAYVCYLRPGRDRQPGSSYEGHGAFERTNGDDLPAPGAGCNP